MGVHDEYNFTVLFEPAEEGGYVVKCPALPGLVTEGDTLEEARGMAEDAIRAYLESLRKDGLPFPEDKKLALEPLKEEVKIVLEVDGCDTHIDETGYPSG
jgi:predicted RNase H-like HicB family nuclease